VPYFHRSEFLETNFRKSGRPTSGQKSEKPRVPSVYVNTVAQIGLAISTRKHFASIQKTPHFRHVVISTLAWGLRPCRFGLGDQAMWMVLFFATMVSLGALGILAACENK
jgi:hypothetical protein